MNSKVKKGLNIGRTILTWSLVLFTVFVMVFTIVTVNTLEKKDSEGKNASIFGYQLYIVLTDSMSESDSGRNSEEKMVEYFVVKDSKGNPIRDAENKYVYVEGFDKAYLENERFDAGDITIVENLTDKEKLNLKPGEIIAFKSFDEDIRINGKTITHMIKKVNYDDKGNVVSYTTFGTNTGNEDAVDVPPEFVYGRYVNHVPNLGNFFEFIRTTKGYILCVLLPFFVLIIYNLVVFIMALYRHLQRKNAAAMERQKAKMEEELKEKDSMLKELEALKAKLAGQLADDSKEESKSDEAN